MTTVSEVPEESCDIVPSKICKFENTLVPHLSPVEKCNDLPREICSFGLKSPKISEKPLITKWCFDPAEDSFEDFEDELPDTPEILLDQDLPELSPIEVEDVLIFSDDVEEKKNEKLIEIRRGDNVNSIDESVNNDDDPEGSIKSRQEQEITEIQQEPRLDIGEEFLEKVADQIGETKNNDDDQNNNSIDAAFIEDINNNIIDEEEGHEDHQFASILSQLNSDFRSKLKIEKADSLDAAHRDVSPLAKIIKHKNSGKVSHTILIKNSPQAHKIFGVMNPPGLQNEVLDFDADNNNTSEDLEFSDAFDYNHSDDVIDGTHDEGSDSITSEGDSDVETAEQVTKSFVESNDNPENLPKTGTTADKEHIN